LNRRKIINRQYWN